MEEPKKEGFTTPAKDFLTENVGVIPTDVFQDPSMQNPFSNVLVTDWVDNPQRKSAPPNSNPVIRDEILIKAKQMVENANSSQPDITDKLFKDVNEQLSFEQHLRQFNSNPVTTIPNNQSAFLDFCYGDLKSCKSGNLFACSKDISRYTNY